MCCLELLRLNRAHKSRSAVLAAWMPTSLRFCVSSPVLTVAFSTAWLRASLMGLVLASTQWMPCAVRCWTSGISARFLLPAIRCVLGLFAVLLSLLSDVCQLDELVFLKAHGCGLRSCPISLPLQVTKRVFFAKIRSTAQEICITR